MAETKKAVLMMHTDQAQGELWQTALATQQLEVIWENISLDLVQYLEKCDRQTRVVDYLQYEESHWRR
jgi:hypothetical protein